MILTTYEILKMNNRSINMKKVNAVRSAKTAAMIDFLKALETGEGDYGGFGSFNIKKVRLVELNSYRAMKIAAYFDKRISKKHLSIFSKDTNYVYRLTYADIDAYLKEYDKELRFYCRFYIQSYVNDALTEFDKITNND